MNSTLVDLLVHRAECQGDKQAYLFLDDGEWEGDRLTFRELHDRALAVAASLPDYSLCPGDRAVLAFAPGLDFITAFFGCLCAGVIAVPVYPPLRRQSSDALDAILRDAEPKVILTDAVVHGLLVERATLSKLPLHIVDKEVTGKKTNGVPIKIQPDTVAFLQYTSGSTAAPKGVIVTHSSILANEEMVRSATDGIQDSTYVSWLPMYHDMGLIGAILQPFYLGSFCVLMSPLAFLEKPVRWLKAIGKYKAQISVAPNFGYELCVRRIIDSEMNGVNLSAWRVTFNGAEPVRAETLNRFSKRFSAYGFSPATHYPCYGLAEATLFVTGGLASEAPVVRYSDAPNAENGSSHNPESSETKRSSLVGCGRPWGQTEIQIVDPETCVPCAPGETGEIWVRGPQVAAGYWNRPEETKRVFHARVDGEAESDYLRTGDLGFVRENELFVTTRIKDLVIINGRNIFPEDVEYAAERSHRAVRPGCSAAFAVEDGMVERLVLVAEASRNCPPDGLAEVVSTLARKIGESFQAPLFDLVLIEAGSISKTTSGKIRRSAVRTAYLDRSLTALARLRDATQVELASRNSIAPSEQGNPSTKTANETISWLREYAKTRIHSTLMDERRGITPNIILDFGEHGLMGLEAPRKFGGLELKTLDAMRVYEQLAAIDTTLCGYIAVHNTLGLRPIQKYATEVLRNELIPKLASGRMLASFGLTEPGAGSNPMAIATTANPVNDGHARRITGSKKWIGNAAWAGAINVFAQERDENGAPNGLSGFVIRQGTPGLRIGKENVTMGLRAMVQNDVHLEGCIVDENSRLGTAGNGFDVAEDAMLHTRLVVGATCVGGLKRCFQLLHRYAARRTINTGLLLEHPTTLQHIGTLRAQINALEALVHRVAVRIDAGKSTPAAIYAAVKAAGPEFLWSGADRLVQILGGRGYTENNPASRLLRDARVLRIFEGPTETIRYHLGSIALHQTNEITSFLRNEFSAPSVSQAFADTSERINEMIRDQSKQLGLVQSRHFGRSAMGELAVWLILEAALTGQSTDADEAALAWLRQQRLSRLSAFTTVGWGDAPYVLPADVESEITKYETSIGNVEQVVPGEEWEPDILLASDPTGSTRNDFRPSTILPTPAFAREEEIFPANAARSESDTTNVAKVGPFDSKDKYTTWVREWLSQKLGTPVEQLGIDANIAEYGVDSLIVAEFVSDIDEMFEIKVPSSLPWNLPTIALLGAYLAQNVSHQLPTAGVDSAVTSPSLVQNPVPNVNKAPVQPSLGPLEGTLGMFRSVDGSDFEARVIPFVQWRNRRCSEKLWQYSRELHGQPTHEIECTCGDGSIATGINFGSIDYLGLSSHPGVKAAVARAAQDYGVHSASVPIFSGTSRVTRQLAAELGELLNFSQVIFFPTGWTAGWGAIAGLIRENDHIVIDELAHNCMQQGARAATQKITLFRHNSTDSVRDRLSRIRTRDTHNAILVVSEGLFSMDSDWPDLSQLQDVCKEFDARLLVDISHDIGSMGPGGTGQLGIQGMNGKVDFVLGGLSKGLAANAGFFACNSQPISEYVKCFSDAYLFGTAFSPTSAAAVREALRIVRSAEGETLRSDVMNACHSMRAALSAEGLTCMGEPSPILPVLIGSESVSRLTNKYAIEHGVIANLMEYPAVPVGKARLRLQLMAQHTTESVTRAARIIGQGVRDSAERLKKSNGGSTGPKSVEQAARVE
jgi:acyl-CoA synthetase (AMP-forming)/AMP-acid ligase II/alkylation response protein AidB-like acyl-CoA dehydrogenase/7-keto-8-aminopelargonate synthetase-like enzyme/acyl carrier protein